MRLRMVRPGLMKNKGSNCAKVLYYVLA